MSELLKAFVKAHDFSSVFGQAQRDGVLLFAFTGFWGTHALCFSFMFAEQEVGQVL